MHNQSELSRSSLFKLFSFKAVFTLRIRLRQLKYVAAVGNKIHCMFCYSPCSALTCANNSNPKEEIILSVTAVSYNPV